MTYRTSEWVSPGHPDKVADGISEYILDKLLELDPNTRYALEVQIKGTFVSLAGEITTSANVDPTTYHDWAKEAVNKIGYTKEYQERWGKENTICGDELTVMSNITQQSPDIAQGVNNDGWGDQGIFTGYAEFDSDFYTPKDRALARGLGMMLYKTAKDENVGGLDIKTQFTLNDDKVTQVIVAIPVLDEHQYEEVKSSVQFWLEVVNGINYLNDKDIIINGTGIYKQHGPIADAGTTGRKLAVDFYGNNAPIGGGCPWTKDGSKADLALNLYAREQALKGLLKYNMQPDLYHYAIYQLCSCIGKTESFGTLKIYDKDGKLQQTVSEELDIKPSELIERYHLKEPIYFKLCTTGLWETYNCPWNRV